jgi:hypothetical protein
MFSLTIGRSRLRAVVHFDRPPGTLNQDWAEARRRAFADMLLHWHKTYLPMHFEPSAMKRYGYQPRSGDNEPPRLTRQTVTVAGKLIEKTYANPHYTWRKRREKRHNRPLVWSGESERVAKNLSNFDIRVRGLVTRGVITGLPRHFFQYHKGGPVTRRGLFGVMQTYFMPRQPDKKAELETVLQGEIADMVRVGQSRIDQYFARASGSTAA